MAFKNFAILASAILSFTTPALAHMQLAYPFPINSQQDPQTPDNLKDYSYTSPLAADGSNYPCKGYQNQRPLRTTASWTAGQQYNITLSGSATHGGGSCQLSLSYDNGKTFRVIKSIIGGCPLASSYDFTVPSYAPNGNALFAWTWMNEVGNREFYSNCAWVDIDSSVTTIPSSSKTKRHNNKLNSAKFRRTTPTSLEDHPFVYRANLPDQNSCTTTEGSDPVFPDPGPDVEYGGKMSASSTPQYQAGTCDASGPAGKTYQDLSTSNTDKTDIGNDPSSSSDGTSSFTLAASDPTSTSPNDGSSTITLAPAASSSSSTSCYSYTTSYSTYTITISGSQTYSPMSSSPTSTSSADSTTTLAITPATSSPVAPSAPSPSSDASSSGTISTNNGGACGSSQMGTLKCTNSGSSFAMCNWGQWVDMGSVAAGTTCTGSDGAASIVASDASSSSTSSSASSSNPSSGSSSASSSISGNSDSASSDAQTSSTSSDSGSATDGGCNGASMGSMKCTNGGQGCAVCNWGSWVDMGAVAAGMECAGADGSAGLVAA